MLYPYEGYRSVTPLGAASVSRMIFDNHFEKRFSTFVFVIIPQKTIGPSLQACWDGAIGMMVPDGFRLQKPWPAALDNYFEALYLVKHGVV